MGVLHGFIMVSPFMACLGAALWVLDVNHGVNGGVGYVFIISASHIIWLLVFAVLTRPKEKGHELPMTVRAVRFLDVFGHLASGKFIDHIPRKKPPLVEAALADVAELRAMMLVCIQSDMLTEEDNDSLVELDARLQGEGKAAVWVVREHTNFFKHTRPYFVHLGTHQKQWQAPVTMEVIDLRVVRSALEELNRRIGHERFPISAAPRASFRQSVKNSFKLAITDSVLESGADYDESNVFQTMRKRPGSRHTIASLPWSYFWQLTLVAVCTWVVVALYGCICMCFKSTETFKVELLGASPVHFLDLSAVVCDHDHVVLGDGFQVLSVMSTKLHNPLRHRMEELSVSSPPLELEPLVQSEDLVTMWRSIAMTRADGGVILLRLESGGRSVLETKFTAQDTRPLSAGWTRRWMLSSGFDANITAISARQHAEVDWALCDGEEDWALFGASPGEVVLLCPANGVLMPRRTVFDLPQAEADVLAGPSALHVEEHGAGLWLMRRDGLHMQVEHWSGERRGLWRLPADRRWAPGFCRSRAGEFWTTAYNRGVLEFWKMTFDGSS